MVRIMRVDHSLQVAAFFLWTPAQSLMYNNVVKNQIECSIAEDAYAYRKKVGIVDDERRVVDEAYGRKAEDQREQIVSLNSIVVNGMM